MLVLVGCTSDAEPAPSATGAFAELVESYLEDPAAAGYSAEQVHLLKSAQQAGELSFEDYAAAVDASLDCIADAGYHVERSTSDADRGYEEVTYFYEGPAEGNPVADQCIYENSQAIEAVYQLQPSSVEASKAHTSAQLAEAAPCLEKLGVTVDSDGLDADEAADAMFRLVQHEQAQLLETNGAIPGPIERCLIDVGY